MVDTREKYPYVFSGIRGNADQGNKLIEIPWEWGTLATGDYSVVGMTDRVAIERKSKEDLYGSVARRDNFKGRLERMSAVAEAGGYCAVMVESDLMDCLMEPPRHSSLNPKSLNRTILAWRQRYRADWWFVQGRDNAEAMTYRILERWWTDHKDQSCDPTRAIPGGSSNS